MKDLGAAPGLLLREDAFRINDNAAAADPSHTTRIRSLLRKRENRRPCAGEGLLL